MLQRRAPKAASGQRHRGLQIPKSHMGRIPSHYSCYWRDCRSQLLQWRWLKSIQEQPRYRLAYYPNYHQAWIEHLARQLRHLRWVRIYLTLPHNRCAERALSCLRSVPKPPQVVVMKVLQPGRDFVEGDGNQFIATRTRQRGVEEDDEGAQKCCYRSFSSELS